MKFTPKHSLISDDDMSNSSGDYITDFNEKNKTFVCDVCLEESDDEYFLMSYCSCRHKCCHNCWKENLQNQYENLYGKFHCFNCSCEIEIYTIEINNLLSKEKCDDYLRRINYIVFRKEIINCPKCKHEYFNINTENSTTCPYCFLTVCPKCLNIEHFDSLNMDCCKFDEFKVSDGTRYHELLNERIKISKDKYYENVTKPIEEAEKRRIEEEFKQKEREKAQRENEEKKQFLKWVKNNNVRRCPKCKNYIEKNKGCNHMTCINCKYEFCWHCSRECDGSGEHFKACPAGGKWFDN